MPFTAWKWDSPCSALHLFLRRLVSVPMSSQRSGWVHFNFWVSVRFPTVAILQARHVGVAEEVPPGARVTWWHQGWHQGWHQALSHLEGGGKWEDGNWSCYVVFACFRSKFQSRFVHKWGILICMVIDKGKIMINYETFRGLLQFLDKSRRHLSEWQIQTSRCGHWGYASALTIWMRCQWVGVTAHRDWRLLQEFVVPIRMPQAIYCRTVIMSQSCL